MLALISDIAARSGSGSPASFSSSSRVRRLYSSAWAMVVPPLWGGGLVLALDLSVALDVRGVRLAPDVDRDDRVHVGREIELFAIATELANQLAHIHEL